MVFVIFVSNNRYNRYLKGVNLIRPGGLLRTRHKFTKISTSTRQEAPTAAAKHVSCQGVILVTGYLLEYQCSAPENLQKWLDFVRSLVNDENWVNSNSSTVCSLHFEEGSRSVGSKSRLVHNAFPTYCVKSNPNPESMNMELSVQTPPHIRERKFVSDHLMVCCPNCHYQFDGYHHEVRNNLPSPSTSLASKSTLTYKRKSEPPTSPPSTPKRQVRSKVARELFTSAIPQQTKIYSKPASPHTIATIKKEHSYSKSPTKPILKLDRMLPIFRKLQKKKSSMIVNMKKSKERETLKDKIASLKSISYEQKEILYQQIPGLLGTLVRNEGVASKAKSKHGIRYSDDLKKFAVTLQFYSSRAYNFLRNYITLPSPRSIRAWMESHDCGPGINLEVIRRLQEARLVDTTGSLTDVNVMVDEMAIKKQLIWNKNKHEFVGHVDFGCGPTEGDSPLANSALVCLVVGLKGGWKCPVGYVFTNKIDSQQQKSFSNAVFHSLHGAGFKVHSLISDGCSSNVAMFRSYGVIESPMNPDGIDGPIRYDDVKTQFPNPADPENSISAVYDIVHVMKLWRGLVAECEGVSWSKGTISFEHVENLQLLQEKEGIIAANKITTTHIQYQQKKMKVDLAVQVISRSVADAIRFCRVDLKIPEFRNSKPTEDLFIMLDKTFDILNSRNLGQRGQKSVIRGTNLIERREFLQHVAKEVLSMVYMELNKNRTTGEIVKTKKWLCRSVRKRTGLGLVVSIKSIISACETLLQREDQPFLFVITYRFCQDHIELVFNKIRGRMGGSNNPTALDFIYIMRRMWHQNQLKSTGTGNCLVLTDENEVPGGLLPLARKKKNLFKPGDDLDEEDIQVPFNTTVDIRKGSPFYSNCLSYIAGVVAKKLQERIKCELCRAALLSSKDDRLEQDVSKLIERKTRGGLLFPSQSVYRIVQLADNVFWNLHKQTSGQFALPLMDLKVAISVARALVGRQIFPTLNNHAIVIDKITLESHSTALVKAVVEMFLRIRFYFYVLICNPTYLQIFWQAPNVRTQAPNATEAPRQAPNRGMRHQVWTQAPNRGMRRVAQYLPMLSHSSQHQERNPFSFPSSTHSEIYVNGFGMGLNGTAYSLNIRNKGTNDASESDFTNISHPALG
ncbi:DNA transposase THAP9 [Folsomia candida]|uniref:DNA transposase THAP9 n=1 Tax=Folsomia candida TaxID=158441 RepID=A0A226F2V0_FOLCA|nr:DNA transposase THAP9 [Folsomia candida]